MFAHRARIFKGLRGLFWAIALLTALIAVGCGSGGDPQPSTTGEQPAAGSSGDANGSGRGDGAGGVEPEIADADPDDVEVISAWSETLSEGDVEGAAEFFALPSVAENGPLVTRIENLEDAIAFNESLPCGAEVTSAETTGDFTTATFRLVERPGGGCGAGVDGTAATSFVIEGGKIAEWRRVGTELERPGSNENTT